MQWKIEIAFERILNNIQELLRKYLLLIDSNIVWYALLFLLKRASNSLCTATTSNLPNKENVLGSLIFVHMG